MNSKSISTQRDEDYSIKTGIIEVYEPDEDSDIELVVYDHRGQQRSSILMSRDNARELAITLLLAVESDL